MLRGLFNNDSRFGQLMTRLFLLIAVNLLFVLSTVPVVTTGAGWCALCHTLLKAKRSIDPISPVREFARGFRANFKQATLSFLLLIGLLAFLFLEWYWCGQFGGFFLTFRYALLMLAVFFLLIALYLFPVIAAFDAPLPKLLSFSLYFAVKNPLYLFVIAFLSAVPLLLTYSFLQVLPLSAFLWAAIGFALIGAVTCSLLLKLFTPYLDASLPSDDTSSSS